MVNLYCMYTNLIVVSLSTIGIDTKNMASHFYVPPSIKTHDSESQGQEEAGHTQRTSELFTRSTALKFVITLNKPP